MNTVFIIHGTGGSPDGNWFPWMKSELEKRNFQVFVPRFPTPENQNLENWMQEFEKYRTYVDEDTIFIAHSVGPSFVCAVLESLEMPIKACYFVSGFLGEIGIPEYDRLNHSFVYRDFDWEKVRHNSKYFYMCQGSDDPYVPLKNAQNLAEKLGVEIDMIDEGGHLNAESGYEAFPYLLDKIVNHLCGFSGGEMGIIDS